MGMGMYEHEARTLGAWKAPHRMTAGKICSLSLLRSF
jgi:hypothetical protein